MSDLTQLVQTFPRIRVALVGDLILDAYVYGDAERISPEAPVPVLRVRERQQRVGGCANVAACLRTLGAQVRCIGVMGRDRSGRTLLDLLSEMDVDASGCVITEHRETTTKTRFVGLAQHRHRQQLIRLDEECVDPLTPGDASVLRDRILATIEESDVICIEDYQKGVVTQSLVADIIEHARKHGKPVLIDPARIGDYSLYSGATVLTPNRTELSDATGLSFETPEQVMAGCNEWRDLWDVECLIVTLDRDGSVVASRGAEPFHMPTRPRSVYDNTGAGDAVLATLAAAIGGGATYVEAARLANIAGGLEVEKFGCVPIKADEILADLRIEERRRSGKLRTLDELLPELQLRRDRGETVVFTNGVYDVLHPGHVDLLAKARNEGSLLVVAINSDESVRTLDKGGDRPINPETFRATMLSAFESVDYVAIFDDSTPTRFIEQIHPDVLVKGGDWAEKGVVGREIVEGYGGRVCLIPFLEGFSSTSIIERIRGGICTHDQ